MPERAFDFEALTPTSFLDRSAVVHAERTAVVDGAFTATYAALHDRCLRLAGVLIDLGLNPGDRVGVLAPNTHMMLEAHYGVPYAGAVLVALNVRLSAGELAHILDHSGCDVLFVDPSLTELGAEVVTRLPRPVRVIDSGADYEALLAAAEPRRVPLTDERSLISLNYTSGTTGLPKGVMYPHRGTYLQALAMMTHFRLDSRSRYLWTLPMFHCNGWCFTWAVTASGGTHVCLDRPDPERVWDLLHREAITHLCAAPTVLVSLARHPGAVRVEGREVVVAVGGAPPSPALLERCRAVGFAVTHLYGLTESLGPVAICDWKPEWDDLAPEEQAEHRARQGVGNLVSCPVRVVTAGEGDAVIDVPADGLSVGEVVVRGNNVMLGYFNDPVATGEALLDGWLRTGDLAVMHSDGYLEIKDRAKDVIISGGENVSSVEVEAVLAAHPAVLEVAVVAMPDDTWGERPAAWVSLVDGAEVTAEELRQHVRAQLASFKVPERFEFGPLPKTGSGKIQKFLLRDALWQGRDRIGRV